MSDERETPEATLSATRAHRVQGMQLGDYNTQNNIYRNVVLTRSAWIFGAVFLVAVVVVAISKVPSGTVQESAPPYRAVEIGVSADPEARPAPTDRMPLATVDVTPIGMAIGASKFALPGDVAPDPAALGATRFTDAYDRLSGIPVDVGIVSFTVRGNITEAVQITRMSVEKECWDPLAQTMMREYTQGGPKPTVQIGIDLDAAVPVVQDMYFDNGVPRLAGPGYFVQHAIPLEPGEMQTFTFGAFTEKQLCAFRIRVFVATSAGTLYQDISGPDGKPFRVTGQAKPVDEDHPYSGYRAMLMYHPGERRWIPQNPQEVGW